MDEEQLQDYGRKVLQKEKTDETKIDMGERFWDQELCQEISLFLDNCKVRMFWCAERSEAQAITCYPNLIT